MFKRLARLFVIKTKVEAYLVTYAIAVGAIERGLHYRAQFPGTIGMVLAVLCTGVVFLAGAKLLDAVKAEQERDAAMAAVPAFAARPWTRRNPVSRNRPRASRSAGARSAVSPRTD
jgi:hypothetical protein